MIPRAMELGRVDLAPRHRHPQAARVVLATVAAIVASLVADAILAAIGTHVFSGISGYPHFRFGDYAKLTVIGVVIAGIAWPITSRITWAPRWMFFRMAILVTAVLLLPDLYIWTQGSPGRAVFVLVWMHLAIALITYNLLVHAAPVEGVRRTAPSGSAAGARHRRRFEL